MEWWLSLIIGVASVFFLHSLIFIVLLQLVKRTWPRWDNYVVDGIRLPSLVLAELALVLVLLRGWDEVTPNNEGKIKQGLRVLIILASCWLLYRVVDAVFRVAVQSVFEPGPSVAVGAGSRSASSREMPDEEQSLMRRMLGNFSLRSEFRLRSLPTDDPGKAQALREAHRRALETQLVVLRRIVIIIIAFFGITGILSIYDELDHFSQVLLVQGSIIALAVGVSAKPLFENMIASTIIAFTQPLKLHDTVNIDGEFGCVEELCSMYMVLRTWDERVLIVPLTRIVSGSFVNLTRSSTDLTASFTIWIDYSLSIKPVRKFVEQFVQAHEAYDGRSVSCTVSDVSELAKQVRVTATVSNGANSYKLKCDLREELLEFIANEYPTGLPHRRHLQHRD